MGDAPCLLSISGRYSAGHDEILLLPDAWLAIVGRRGTSVEQRMHVEFDTECNNL